MRVSHLKTLAAPAALSAAALLLNLAVGASPVGAKSAPKRTKSVTYLATLKIDGRTLAGPFASTETVTGELLANPTSAANPTAWRGEGPLTFGPITNTGLPAGCTLENPRPTGTWKTALVRSGASLDVVWSTNASALGTPVVTCPGVTSNGLPGAPAVEPLAFLEPHEFTISANGGTQPLKGALEGGGGIMENIGTLTITKRVECEPKVKDVYTWPPGQQTQLANMVGHGFSPGETLTANVNVGFVLADGSEFRMTKGSSYRESDTCGGFDDTSRSFKGTLLLGKLWANVTKLFGERTYDLQAGQERAVCGNRGTTFWMVSGGRLAQVSVSRGSVWFSRATKSGELRGRKVIVRAGWTATMNRKGKITLRRTRRSDAFPEFAKR